MARAAGEPAEATARKIAMLVDLLRTRRLPLADAMTRYGISERQLLRDLQELRTLGESLGFRIGKRNAYGEVELAEFAARPSAVVRGDRALRSLVRELFNAFGAPLAPFAQELGSDGAGDGFVRVVAPQLAEGAEVAQTLRTLTDAYESGAAVRFRYKGREREVEPAVTMVRSGRYYLVGRERAAQAKWRIYSMDEIRGPIHRCGTFAPQPPPAEYLSTDAIGWIKKGTVQAVEVTVSERLAHAAVSRVWQRAQETRSHADGTATLVFRVGDVDEVVRWALGFGPDAWVSAPPAAVARARELVAEVAARYETT
ncbi:MAG: WYL domain-containing transcriptional regulator [bacterium]|nr:WYL domain-containing transcriptional regulator [bacterium]